MGSGPPDRQDPARLHHLGIADVHGALAITGALVTAGMAVWCGFDRGRDALALAIVIGAGSTLWAATWGVLTRGSAVGRTLAFSAYAVLAVGLSLGFGVLCLGV